MRLWRDTGRCIMGAMRAQRRRDMARLTDLRLERLWCILGD